MPQQPQLGAPRADLALGAALLAAVIGIMGSLAARSFFGLPTPAELFGDQLTALIPLPLFSRLLNLFGPNTKHWYYGSLLVIEGLLTMVVGTGALRLRARYAIRWRAWSRGRLFAGTVPGYVEALPLTLALWLLSAGIVAPLLGAGLFGAGLAGGIVGVFGAELLPNGLFALALVALLRRAAFAPASQSTGAPDSAFSRRRLLGQVGFAATVVVGGALAWVFISDVLSSATGGSIGARPQLRLGPMPDRIVPPPVPTYADWSPARGQTTEVTPTARFYYVSKNLASDPTVDQSTWRLSIKGLVDHPYTLSYAELLALPTVERFHTLACISNQVGGNLISTARFTGVRLADLLNRAGIATGATTMIFRAADGYADALHLSQALDPDALVVYRINGEPLPAAHGFPARMLIPGLYGMKNGKWLSELELTGADFTGFWEERGWTREATIKTMSRIDLPHDGDFLLLQPTTLAGIAFAGARGIARVDVSTDGGQTWQPATLRRPLGALTWTLWQFAWTPPAGGSYVLAVRAIDLDGNVQTPATADPLPDGASGYHAISVVVR